MGQSRKKNNSRSSRKSLPNKKIGNQNSDSNEVLKKLDGLRTNVKKEQKAIPKPKNKNVQIAAFAIIIIIGLSGIILLSDLNTQGNIPGNSGDKPPVLVDTTGGFQYDKVGTDSYSNGRVDVFFASGEFCPYCAMERWAIVMALSQFGNFSNLGQIVTPANEGSVSSYTFIGSSYSSENVEFQPVELLDLNSQPLQSFSQPQEYLFNRYNTGGSIPFILIGGTTFRIGLGPSFNYNAFSGVSFSEIQSQVNNQSGNLYNQIKVESDYIVTIVNQFLTKASTTSSSTSS